MCLSLYSHSSRSPTERQKRKGSSWIASLCPIGLYGTLAYPTAEYYHIHIMPKAIYKEEHKKIVERLKEARLAAGLGQVEVAEKLGRTQSYISKIESGQRRFDVLQLKEFAKIYKKDLGFFLK